MAGFQYASLNLQKQTRAFNKLSKMKLFIWIDDLVKSKKRGLS